ncbi:MAG: PDZ domain-containing protein, partial [Deltaproteobacteria bacterium]|nr:PDZ domain-containing protein [Deltaproteobacteria bacterium]
AVDDAQRLRWLAATAGIGKEVPLTFQRRGRLERSVAKLAVMPDAEPAGTTPQPVIVGLVVREVDVPTARSEGLALPLGAVVREVKPGSAASQAGIRAGDVILKLNDVNIHAPGNLTRAFNRLESGGVARVVLRRDGQTHFLALRKP